MSFEFGTVYILMKMVIKLFDNIEIVFGSKSRQFEEQIQWKLQ